MKHASVALKGERFFSLCSYWKRAIPLEELLAVNNEAQKLAWKLQADAGECHTSGLAQPAISTHPLAKGHPHLRPVHLHSALLQWQPSTMPYTPPAVLHYCNIVMQHICNIIALQGVTWLHSCLGGIYIRCMQAQNVIFWVRVQASAWWVLMAPFTTRFWTSSSTWDLLLHASL